MLNGKVSGDCISELQSSCIPSTIYMFWMRQGFKRWRQGCMLAILLYMSMDVCWSTLSLYQSIIMLHVAYVYGGSFMVRISLFKHVKKVHLNTIHISNCIVYIHGFLRFPECFAVIHNNSYNSSYFISACPARLAIPENLCWPSVERKESNVGLQHGLPITQIGQEMMVRRFLVR